MSRRGAGGLFAALGLAALAACSEGPRASVDPAAPGASASAAVNDEGRGHLAGADPAKAVRDATLAGSRALDNARGLSDEAGPRLAGSPGDPLAVAWALRAMTAEGLAHVHSEPVVAPHWERGEEQGEITAPHPQKVVLAALGGSVGTPAAGLEAEVVRAETIEALEALDPKLVAGKIVFFDTVMESSRDGSSYAKAVKPRVFGPSRAAKLGALAIVIRSVGTDRDRHPHTGTLFYDPAVPKIPAAALSIPDASLLARLLEKGPVRLSLKLGAKVLPDASTANVVGEIEGSEAPNEIVLLGAHLDSWDLGRGAIDDAAGCGIILEAARQIGKLAKKPRRTVRIVFFANEENGGAGAKAYAKAHEAELGKHVLAMEADLGGGRVFESRFLGPDAALAAFAPLAAAVKPLGVERSNEPAEGGSDINQLLPAGVPLMDLRHDATLYFDVHHTANDTVERIKKEDIDQAAAAYAAAAFMAADSQDDFGRVPEDKRTRKH